MAADVMCALNPSQIGAEHGVSVLTAPWDTTAKIWNASTGECVPSLSGHSGQVSSAEICNASTGECVPTPAR